MVHSLRLVCLRCLARKAAPLPGFVASVSACGVFLECQQRIRVRVMKDENVPIVNEKV